MNIKVTELSQKAYEPFGQFVSLPTHKPTIEEDIVKYWAGLAGFKIDGTIDVGWVTMRKRPFILSQMERHFQTVEVAIPVDDAMVLPVAIGREPFDYESQPLIDDVRGFCLRPGQMVTYSPGTWHFGGFPINKPEASFLVLTRRGTADTDVSMQSIFENDQVEFTL
jgi:ureidoglycolate hydrolase